MQESVPQWDPTAINHVPPWGVKLLFLYLLLASIFLLVRVAQVSWFLWESRKFVRNDSEASGLTTRELQPLRSASIKTNSLRKGAILTLLVSLLTVVGQISVILRVASTEKHFGPAFLAGSFAEALLPFASGLVVCTALYLGFAILDGKLAPHRMLWEAEQVDKS